MCFKKLNVEKTPVFCSAVLHAVLKKGDNDDDAKGGVLGNSIQKRYQFFPLQFTNVLVKNGDDYNYDK